ncbi:MAG: hypothetical protein AUJ07_07555 [Crenarchaeota archaeon 13_1_40CM_3_53_5]|nr:MAG: hypothetical protein AUJ07_07555 [Crenarchaeota archaeon 13_1_40CM_3_53_5]
MARYHVKGKPRLDRLGELKQRLDSGEVSLMQPFGRALEYSLRNAKMTEAGGAAVWEEKDYCSPPLAQERAAVLNRYFESIETRRVERGEGWNEVSKLPSLWTLLAKETTAST